MASSNVYVVIPDLEPFALGSLNPEKDSNFFGDEPKMLVSQRD